jgi:hypothetical protein
MAYRAAPVGGEGAVPLALQFEKASSEVSAIGFLITRMQPGEARAIGVGWTALS